MPQSATIRIENSSTRACDAVTKEAVAEEDGFESLDTRKAYLLMSMNILRMKTAESKNGLSFHSSR